MLRWRKWNIYPPIFSNDGKIINELEITGKLFLNDNNDVFTNAPTQNQILVWNAQENRWENQDQVTPPTPVTALCDEIRMFGGDVVSNFPSGEGVGEYDGWYLCNGLNGTLDLQSRFVLGLDNTTGAFPTIGATGGEEQVTLTGGQSGTSIHTHGATGLNTSSAGAHTHTMATTKGSSAGTNHLKRRNSNDPNTLNSSSAGSHTHPITGNTAASVASDASQAHNNIPPYIVVAFIQYKNCPPPSL